MAERVMGFVVALEADLHEDIAAQIADAIRLIRGVADVSSVEVDPGDYINRTQVRIELEKSIWQALREKKGT
jgi:hypothetical protein